jgi:isopentenyl phosphate kinase
MDRPPTIVKLGGSVITRKREVERPRTKVIHELAAGLGRVTDTPLVLLHGAGSFGHPGAVRWKLAKPGSMAGKEGAHRRRGAALVASEVRRLHHIVLKALLAAGVDAFSIPPFALARNREGRLESFDVRPFAEALREGLVPLSMGDVVPDSAWGFSILSADTIAVELARRLGARRVVFVSDVPGVLESGPTRRRTVVPWIGPETLEKLRPTVGVPDVTGGIRGKATAMLEIAKGGADAGLISGLRDGALLGAIRGDFVYGSWARAAPR